MPYIKDYGSKPSFEPLDKDLYGIYLGVELEVEVKDDFQPEDKAGNVTNALGNFIITKHDGSLQRGFEICSSPASLKFHKSNWNNFFQENILKGLRGYKSPRTGMHVHISRSCLSDLQIGKMLVFIHNPDNHKFITDIAQRESGEYNNFKTAHKYGDINRGFGRHTALNLQNGNTVEIRIFKSNLKKEVFFKNLEFCDALVRFTWSGAYSIKEAKTYQTFCEFIEKSRATYPFLYNFLVYKKYLKQKFTKKEIAPAPIAKTIVETVKNETAQKKLKERLKGKFSLKTKDIKMVNNKGDLINWD